MVVRDTLGEACLNDEVSRLLVEVLLQVGANDDVHGRGLADLVLVQAAVLVGLEHEWTNRTQNSKLLIRDRDKVDGFRCKRIDRA